MPLIGSCDSASTQIQSTITLEMQSALFEERSPGRWWDKPRLRPGSNRTCAQSGQLNRPPWCGFEMSRPQESHTGVGVNLTNNSYRLPELRAIRIVPSPVLAVIGLNEAPV
jgi:hypothetical protein